VSHGVARQDSPEMARTTISLGSPSGSPRSSPILLAVDDHRKPLISLFHADVQRNPSPKLGYSVPLGYSLSPSLGSPVPDRISTGVPQLLPACSRHGDRIGQWIAWW
jgi:hypothetical protein